MWKVGQKYPVFSNERHFEIWLPKKKTITCFWSKLSKLHKKDPILHVTATLSLKQGETRTNIVPIPHPLTEEEEGEKDIDGESGVDISRGHSLVQSDVHVNPGF